MFPETYGRTLEELAFLFEDRALADEATMKVEKQMEWSAEQRWSRVDDRMSWDMDVIMPNKFDVRTHDNDMRRASVSGNTGATAAHGLTREIEPVQGRHKQAIRGERGGWFDN
jgi:transposase